MPNFITLKSVTGKVISDLTETDEFPNNIILLVRADPGYDWVFSHGIGGLITTYGGANSHMAIRASELGIPAVIGAGEVLVKQWQRARVLSIDAGNRQVKILQ